MTLPNLIIAGAQKCATSALFDCLASHPQCLMSHPKEPTFFSRAENLANLDRYRACFTQCSASAATPSPRVVGEASTGYMAEAYVPARIRQVLGDHVKLVFLVRSPAARVVSAYWHTYKRSDERRGLEHVFADLPDDIEAASQQEAVRIRAAVAEGTIKDQRYSQRYDDPLWPFRYLFNSRYTLLIDRFAEHYPPSCLHIIVLESLVRNPGQTLCKLAAFLGIDPDPLPEDFSREVNATVVPRGGVAGRVFEAVTCSAVQPTLRRRAPSLYAFCHRVAYRSKPPVSAHLHDRLRSLYAHETRRLSERLGCDLTEMGW